MDNLEVLNNAIGKKMIDKTCSQHDSDALSFPPGSVPVRIAARVYSKDPNWVRAGIIGGWLPIGVATRDGKQITDISEADSRKGRINYYISPKKLWEDTGYIWKGEE